MATDTETDDVVELKTSNGDGDESMKTPPDTDGPPPFKAKGRGRIGESELLNRSATQAGIKVPKSTTWDEWAQAVKVSGRRSTGDDWALGDLIVFGEDRWGEEAAAALDASDVNPQTASNAASLSRAYAYDERYTLELSKTHHRIAVGLVDPYRDRALRFAIQEGLNTTAFAKYVAKIKAEIEGAQSNGSAARSKPTHLTYTISYTVLADDKDGAEQVFRGAQAWVRGELGKRSIEATRFKANSPGD